jgi:hypothetical protein
MAAPLVPPGKSADGPSASAGAALELVVSLVCSTVVTSEVGQSSVSFVARSVGTYKQLFGFDRVVEIVDSVLDKRLILWPEFWGIHQGGRWDVYMRR